MNNNLFLTNRIHNLIISHRGESFDAPENTIASINLAWERGIMSVEVDIRQTLDKKIIVIHDRDTRRVTGSRRVVSRSYYADINQLSAGSYKGSEWAGERIPTLDDALSTVPENRRIIIEIKSDSSILQTLKNVLDKSGLESNQVELIGYNLKTMSLAKQLMPHYKILWILDLDYYIPKQFLPVNIKKIIRRTNEMNLDGVDVWAGKVLTPAFIKEFKNNNLLVYAWTVDSVEKARHCIESGIDGLTTNRGNWLFKQLTLDY